MRTLSTALLSALAALAALTFSPEAHAENLELSLERGLRVTDPGSSNTLKLGFLGQMSFEASLERDSPRLNFSLPVARPFINASLMDERLTLFVQPELAGSAARLLDAEAVIALGDCYCSPRISVGYYRPWFTRSWRTGLPQLAFSTRGAAARAFHGPRSLGVSVGGRPGIFEYHVGVFNGQTPQQVPGAIPRLLTARVAINPLGPVPYTQTPWFEDLPGPRLSIGLNGAYALPVEASRDGGFIEREQATGALDVAFLTPHLSVLAEGFARAELDTDELSWGSYLQINGLLAEKVWDIGGRVGVFRLADDFTSGQTDLHVELSSTLYLAGPSARLMFYYRAERGLDSGNGLDALGTQAQLWF